MIMAATTTGDRREAGYDAVARACHWLTAAMLLAIVPIGLVMADLPRGLLQDTLFVMHESLGLTVLALTLLRLGWRLAHPPAPAAALGPLQRRASGGVHALLYLLLVAMPVTGYLFVTFSGIALHYLGLVEVPALVEKAKPRADLAILVHTSLQWALYALVALHVAAALYHHRRGDGVLARMLPRVARAPLSGKDSLPGTG
jgi:cytochrome b561